MKIRAQLWLGGACAAAALVACSPAIWGQSPVPESAPEWAGSENSIHYWDTFSNGVERRAPEGAESPEYGTPMLDIDVGESGEGWQDPGDPKSVTRSDSGGAWDIGLDGSVRLEVPFAPPIAEGQTYDLDYFINAVFEENLFNHPEVRLSGYPGALESAPASTYDPADGFPLRSWGLKTWSGQLTGLQTNVLTFAAEATGEVGSLIETYEVYTRFSTSSDSEPESGFSFADWQEAHFSDEELADSGISGWAADPDGRGVANGQRYAFGMSPSAPERERMPRLELVSDSGRQYLSIVFRRLQGRSDVTYTVESSDDLVQWQPADVTMETIAEGDTIENVRARENIALSGQPRFLRVSVSPE